MIEDHRLRRAHAGAAGDAQQLGIQGPREALQLRQVQRRDGLELGEVAEAALRHRELAAQRTQLVDLRAPQLAVGLAARGRVVLVELGELDRLES